MRHSYPVSQTLPRWGRNDAVNKKPVVATFSIVASDLEAEEWGIAVASKFLAVGSVVPWLQAKIGAVATQAWANLSFGPDGLQLLASGKPAKEVIDELVAGDEGREHRQVGIVDAQGRSATFTGKECFDWAGGVDGDGLAIQGNILSGPEVVESMREAFLSSTGVLADRLLQALLAGDRSGGDRRGRQSAALVVVREGGGYGGHTDRALDLRVDDHPDPVPELIRLRSIHRLLLETTRPEDELTINSEIASEIQSMLSSVGSYSGDLTGVYDEVTAKSLRDYMSTENLEQRWLDGNRIDRNVLEYMRGKHG